MPRQTRHSTEFSGVYFVELANENKSFFIRYKRNGKSVEERAGRSNEGWDAELAYLLRSERMSVIEFQAGNIQHGSDLKTRRHWTFSKIFEKYLRLRPDLKGRENDIYRFKNYLEMVFADIAPADVSHGDVERFRHNLQNKGLKPATVGHVLELLRRLANFAVKKNYCRGLSFKLEMPKVENQKTEDLSQHQLEKLLQVLEEEPDLQVSNLVRMALYTGMRRGELFELCWSDIDFHNKTITVRSGKKGQYPTIPLNEMAEKVLAEHAHVPGSSKFVFPGRNGKKRTECKRPLLRIRKNAGLPEDFRLLQGLRHVYATMLVSSGKVDLETLQSLLTQKSPLMTQRYAHLLDQSVEVQETELATDSIDSDETPEVLLATDSTDTEIATDYTENVDNEEAEEVTKVLTATDNVDSQSNGEDTEMVMATDYTDSSDSTDMDEIATDYTDREIATDYTESEYFEEVADCEIAQDYTDGEIVSDYTETQIATDYTDNEIAKYYAENSENDETEEIADTEIPTDNMETKILTDYIENADNDETEEAAIVITAADNADSQSNEEDTEMVIATDTTDSSDTTYMDERGDVEDDEITMENTEIEIITDNTDLEETTEVPETEVTTYSVQQNEISTAEPENKIPELSQLVKQNYFAVEPKEIQHGEVSSPKTIVVEKKVEERVQKKARPTLKDLKKDLKSLSQLIQASPRRSKNSVPKRNQS
jgi:integrase